MAHQVQNMNAYNNCWTLLVGVNQYDDYAISDLHVCSGDVQAVYQVLTAQNYQAEQVKLLLSPAEDGSNRASRTEILATLTTLAEAADEHDLLLFYFSGHGTAYQKEAYILPADTHYTVIGDTAISLNRIKQILQSSRAQAKVMILDACHSGAQIGKASPEMTAEFMQRVFAEAEGLAILSSCKQQQVSWEWKEKRQSVFTHFLLEGLQGAADFDRKELVTIGDVNRYVTDKVKSWSVQNNRTQTPTLQYTAVGDIVLIVLSATMQSDFSENSGGTETQFATEDTDNKHVENAVEQQTLEKSQTTGEEKLKLDQKILLYLSQQAPDDKIRLSELCQAIHETSKESVLEPLDKLEAKHYIKQEGLDRQHILCWITYTGRQMVKEFLS